MTRYKAQIESIIRAALVILLCLAFIIGSTFALFTDNDGKIGINATAGNLEVDIVDTSETPQSLVGDVLNFITTAQNPVALFEPGATFHTEGFRVKNEGNIPLNFILYISNDSEISDGFSDAFEVWITNDVTDRTSGERLQDFSGRLEIGESSDVYYLVFRMKETAGNEYQNRVFTGVGITVCAVQGNVEIR